MTSPSLRDRIIAYLKLCHAEGALYTADIAWGAREGFTAVMTATVRRELLRMHRDGLVVRVLQGRQGRPASWRLP